MLLSGIWRYAIIEETGALAPSKLPLAAVSEMYG